MEEEDNRRDTAYILYIDGKHTLKQIGERLKVHPNTLTIWCRQGNWKKIRDARIATPGYITAMCFQQCHQIASKAITENRVLSAAEIKHITSLAKTAQLLETRVSPSIYMKALSDFNNYLVMADQPLAQKVVDHEMAYIDKMMAHDHKSVLKL